MRYNEFNILKEEKTIDDRIRFIADKMKANPDIVQRVYRLVKMSTREEDGDTISSMLAKGKTGTETDHQQRGVLKLFIAALNETPGDYNDLEEFLKNYGKVSYINEKLLMADGQRNWETWLTGVGKVNKAFIHKLFENLFDIKINISGSNRGPGEIGLALLSPNITFAKVGDLIINGEEVEVKGESASGGGRLKNSNADFGVPNLERVYQEFEIPQEEWPERSPSGAPGSKAGRFYKDIADRLDGIVKGAGTAYIQELFEKTYIHGDPALIAQMIQGWKGDRNTVAELGYAISYSNYTNILKGKGFSKFLFLKRNGETSLAFDVDNYKKYLDKFKMTSLDFDDQQTGPAVQVSML